MSWIFKKQSATTTATATCAAKFNIGCAESNLLNPQFEVLPISYGYTGYTLREQSESGSTDKDNLFLKITFSGSDSGCGCVIDSGHTHFLKKIQLIP